MENMSQIDESPQPGQKHHYRLEILTVAVAFLLINVLSFTFQKPISVNGGKGWDGVFYHHLAEQFAAGKRPEADAPFVFRMGTPFLASLVAPHSLIRGFFAVNIFANILLVLLIVVWFRLYLRDWRLRAALAVIFMACWHTPARFTYFYPVLTDNYATAFTLAGLILIEKMGSRASWPWLIGVSIITFAGMFFRETVLLVALTAIFRGNPLAWDDKAIVPLRLANRPPVRIFLPLVFGLFALSIIHLIAVPTGAYSYLKAVGEWIINKRARFYVHDFFLTFGVIPWILLYSWRGSIEFLARRQFQFVFLGCIAVSAYIGGSDTLRFFSAASPVVLLMAGILLEENWRLYGSAALMAFMGVCQAVSQRWFLTTPDQFKPAGWPIPLLTMVGPNATYLSLNAQFCDVKIQFIGLAEYLILGAVLIFWFRFRDHVLSGLKQ
jgi:hypothetical protein